MFCVSLTFDNLKDSFRMNNLIGQASHAQIQQKPEQDLIATLARRGDELRPGLVMCANGTRWWWRQKPCFTKK